MGACGCGESIGDYIIFSDDKKAYTLQIYQPCKDCETPLGVIIRYFNKSSIVWTDVQNLPTLDYSENDDCYLKLLSPRHFKEELKGMLEEVADEILDATLSRTDL